MTECARAKWRDEGGEGTRGARFRSGALYTDARDACHVHPDAFV